MRGHNAISRHHLHIIGILGAIFALFAWLKARQVQQEFQKEQQRQSRKITVILNYRPQPLELPVQIRRIELTRAEILGHIGMLPMKTQARDLVLAISKSPIFFSIFTRALVVPATRRSRSRVQSNRAA